MTGTPAPQGRWTVTDGCVTRDDGAEVSCFGPPHTDESADRALAVEVAGLLNGRRDGADPTPEDVHAYMATEFRTWTTIGQVRSVLAAVRALRDGGTR